jgi:RNA polymerase sigma-B factor
VSPDDADWRTRQGQVNELLVRLREAPPGSSEARALRDELAEMHLPLVRYLARRFADRHIPLDDLAQVGAIGLIKAIDRFDPERGVEFASYATPTIVGEIRRHFRDNGWLVHVPRRAQELQATVGRARADLSQELHRAPTVAELAERTGVEADHIVEALDIAHGYTGVPIDVLIDPETGTDKAALAMNDAALDGVEMRAVLRPALEALPEREQVVLLLRFVAGKTQTEIAEIVGVSQMQVSRLIARSLAQLRETLVPADGLEPV